MDENPDVRGEWARRHPPGTPAVFTEGQELRCPAPRKNVTGAVVTCGYSLRIWVGPGLRLMVRPRLGNACRIVGASDYHCKTCHNVSELSVLRDRLEATG